MGDKLFCGLLVGGLMLGAGAGRASQQAASKPQVLRTPQSQPVRTIASLPIDREQESALLELVGDGFQIRRTAHFIIAHNASPALVGEFVSRVEQTYAAVYRFCDANQIAAVRPDRRLEVVFFERPEQYLRFCRQCAYNASGTFGNYYEATNRSAFFNVNNEPQLLALSDQIAAARLNMDRMRRSVKSITDKHARLDVQFGDGSRATMTADQARRQIDQAQRELKNLDLRRKGYSERINCTVVQHEIAHQVLFNADLHRRKASNPRWLVEGLATLFETPPTLQGSGLRVTNPMRLKDFRDAVGKNKHPAAIGADDYMAAVAAGVLVSPRQLLLHPELLGGRSEDGARHYAVAWALAHYLQSTRRADLAAYLQELNTRPANIAVTPAQELELFEKHFGTLDENFTRRFATAILRLNYRAPVDGF